MQMIVRSAQQTTTVRVTNYHRDAQRSATWPPLRDDSGAYIGTVLEFGRCCVHPDDALLKVLRSSTDVARCRCVPTFDQLEKRLRGQPQFNDALTQFLPYDWSASWDVSLKTLLAQPASLAALMAWASAESPEDLPQLALLADGTALQDTDAREAGSLAIELCMKHFDVTYSDSVAALAMLQEQTSRAVMEFSTHSFPRFTRSKACLSLSQALRGPARPAVDARPDLIWSGYEVPEDCAGWLYALVSKAEFHPVNFVISDMSMPGNPMILVIHTFCSTTGYEKYEAQGRNCRFLQGPATEPESVAVIQDTLRRGADCHVRISNYRKDGSMFVNLLTMRPIHDSNNVYRYCIGVQFELSPSVPIKEQATTLDNLIQLIPIQIEVSSQRTGAMHRRTELNAESTTELAVKLERAMAGDGALAAHSLEARRGGMKLRNNHERVLKDVCNASPDTNIDGKPLTQLGLVRVPPEHGLLRMRPSPRLSGAYWRGLV